MGFIHQTLPLSTKPFVSSPISQLPCIRQNAAVCRDKTISPYSLKGHHSLTVAYMSLIIFLSAIISIANAFPADSQSVYTERFLLTPSNIGTGNQQLHLSRKPLALAPISHSQAIKKQTRNKLTENHHSMPFKCR